MICFELRRKTAKTRQPGTERDQCNDESEKKPNDALHDLSTPPCESIAQSSEGTAAMMSQITIILSKVMQCSSDQAAGFSLRLFVVLKSRPHKGKRHFRIVQYVNRPGLVGHGVRVVDLTGNLDTAVRWKKTAPIRS
jgi:hypothetical protein